jgi:hypothetical protein
LVLGIEAFLIVLVCLGLGILEGFFAVILGIPSISEVFNSLLSGSVLGYHGQDKVTEGFIVEIWALCKVRVVADVWLRGLSILIHD